jgi:hypothetical protein
MQNSVNQYAVVVELTLVSAVKETSFVGRGVPRISYRCRDDNNGWIWLVYDERQNDAPVPLFKVGDKVVFGIKGYSTRATVVRAQGDLLPGKGVENSY